MSRTLLRSLFSFDPRPAPEVDADIRAELDSHLAMIEEELLAQGAAPADARARALARFGDPARLARQARTIKLGDRIMLQRINLALLIVLGSAVIFLLVQNQRINSRSIQTLEQVSASLTALQQRQPAPAAALPAAARSEFVYIGGTVQRPGTYMIPHGGLTLKRLIDAAGGPQEGAKSVIIEHQPQGIFDPELFDVRELMSPNGRDIDLDAGNRVSIGSEEPPARGPEPDGVDVDSPQVKKFAETDEILKQFLRSRDDLKALLASGDAAKSHNKRATQLRVRSLESTIQRRVAELAPLP